MNAIIYETLNEVKTMKSFRGEDGFMHLSGVFGVCGVVNNNKRIYEAGNYKKMIEELKKRIETEGCPGELEHPNTMNITLENISHKIDKIDIDDKGVITGEITLLDTPKGKIAQSIVEGGLPLFISSRAQGNVDAKGHVTLETLRTYDLVGTPGFSQARLNLKEGQVAESICESVYYVTNENENENKQNNIFNMDNTNSALIERIEKLESTVVVLREELRNKQNLDVKEITEGIQSWLENVYTKEIEKYIEEDFATKIFNRIDESIEDYTTKKIAPGVERWFADEMLPKIQQWTEKEYGKEMVENLRNYIDNDYSKKVNEWVVSEVSPQIQKWVTNEYSEGLQQWITEHFGKEIEKWVTEEYSNGVQQWITEHYSNVLQNWVINEYSTDVQKWLNEEFSKGITNWIINEYSPVIEKWVLEEAKSAILEGREEDVPSRESKLNAIDSMLSMLENNVQEAKKPVYKGSRMLNEGMEDEPLFVRNMPAEYVAKWTMASNAVKENIKRKASIYKLMNEEQIARFWQSVDFTEPTAAVKENLNEIVDNNERNLRAQLRRFRNA